MLARRLIPRSPKQADRASTPLELFFDLCLVVAVAQAAATLHEVLAEGRVSMALVGYPMVFFAIWWAWMGFTWFASAYDNDGVAIRLAVFVHIVGVLVIAAGIHGALVDHDFAPIVLGYVIMRLALVSLWLWVAGSDRPRRRTALRYAVGITVVQLGWVGFLLVPDQLQLPAFLLLAAAELAVPVYGEKAGATPWHPHHIAERYGGFTIIVLGESILSIMLAVRVAVIGGADSLDIVPTVLGGVLIVSAMWWLYFSEPSGRVVSSARESFESSGRTAYLWGYGHFAIYMAAAAAGAGIAAVVDAVAHDTGMVAATLALAVPVSIYVVCMMALHKHAHDHGAGRVLPDWVAYLGCAAAVLGFGAFGLPIAGIGLLLGLLIVYVSAAHPGDSATDAVH